MRALKTHLLFSCFDFLVQFKLRKDQPSSLPPFLPPFSCQMWIFFFQRSLYDPSSSSSYNSMETSCEQPLISPRIPTAVLLCTPWRKEAVWKKILLFPCCNVNICRQQLRQEYSGTSIQRTEQIMDWIEMMEGINVVKHIDKQRPAWPWTDQYIEVLLYAPLPPPLKKEKKKISRRRSVLVPSLLLLLLPSPGARGQSDASPRYRPPTGGAKKGEPEKTAYFFHLLLLLLLRPFPSKAKLLDGDRFFFTRRSWNAMSPSCSYSSSDKVFGHPPLTKKLQLSNWFSLSIIYWLAAGLWSGSVLVPRRYYPHALMKESTTVDFWYTAVLLSYTVQHWCLRNKMCILWSYKSKWSVKFGLVRHSGVLLYHHFHFPHTTSPFYPDFFSSLLRY